MAIIIEIDNLDQGSLTQKSDGPQFVARGPHSKILIIKSYIKIQYIKLSDKNIFLFRFFAQFDKFKELNFLISLVIRRNIFFYGLRAAGRTPLT